MRVFRAAAEITAWVATQRAQGETIALVPTMGFLHQGHLSLVELAKRHASVVITYIFVNPAQFNDPKDLEKYPRDEVRDTTLLESVGTSALFVPPLSEIYPPGYTTFVDVGGVSEPLEGAHRPGHFRGVATVLSLFFNIIRPDVAVFGEKDFQQLRVIERFVKDLHFGVRIIRAPLVREADGLALSSRNVRLSPEERGAALSLSRSLTIAKAAVAAGERHASALRAMIEQELAKQPLVQVEYVAIASEEDLLPVDIVSEGSRALIAAFVGNTRLIDTMAL